MREVANRLYFSYGSKMDRAHAIRLCRGTEVLGVAHVENLIFYIGVRGLASVGSRRNSKVYGVFRWMIAEDLVKRDAYESVQLGLYRRSMIAVHHGGKLLRAMIYYAVDARATSGYQKKIVAAAQSGDLPENYLRELEKFLSAALAR